ncbi:hypothetical protein [Actinomadura atramentaria]|uniref:hypothetical protein n=1 Tax=Actinomadura atramentaria TaxID=1990 RepID=UPI0003A6E2AC|nr:hypothetical protein [Actinomadura atramentaria]
MTFSPPPGPPPGPPQPPGPPPRGAEARPRAFLVGLGAVAPLLVLFVVFGNPWVRTWLFTHVHADESILTPVMWLSFLDWGFGRGHQPPADYLVLDLLGTLLALGLTLLLATGAARSLDPRRGAFGAFAGAWWAALVGCAVGGFVKGGAVIASSGGYGSTQYRMLWTVMESGLGFAIVYGWLGGAVAVLAYFAGRGKAGAAGPGAPLAPGHPAGVPYTPPAGAQGPPVGWGPPQQPVPQPVPQPAPPQPYAPQPYAAQPGGWGAPQPPPPPGQQPGPYGRQPPPPPGQQPPPPPGQPGEPSSQGQQPPEPPGHEPERPTPSKPSEPSNQDARDASDEPGEAPGPDDDEVTRADRRDA